MKRILAVFTLSFMALMAGAADDDLLHIKRFLGFAEILDTSLDKRDTYYWSLGTEVNGSGSIFSASQEFSCGIAQADYRLCTYEDGSPIFEDGKYFLNVSSRMAGVVQTVYSYDVNTCRFTLIGMLRGYRDGKPFKISAPHIIYNRQDGMWYIFAHWEKPHNLCVSKCYRDPRYGYNEAHMSLLDYSDKTKGDEDNFVYYDPDIKRWVLVYSRGSSTIARQISKRIDGGYRMVCSNDEVKSLTGINVVRVGGKRYIVTGSMWNPQEDAYKVFDAEDLSYLYDLNLDIPTGGFRGWGTLIGVTEGMETKYQLLTFDRANPDPVDRWQYGNMYMYEAAERNPGSEYDLVRPDGRVIKADAKQVHSPKDLHFKRKFSRRMNYSQSIRTGVLDLSGRIFLKNGNIYPVKDNAGQISWNQRGSSIYVEGEGNLSLLCGLHLPSAEYVVDLKEMQENEVRYLKIGTMTEDVAVIRFRLCGDELLVLSGQKELLRLDPGVNRIRVTFKGKKAYFIDASE